MCFLRCLAILVALSSALEDCADASCALKAQQLLQKGRTQRSLKVKSVKERDTQHIDLDNYKVLQSFVDLVALQTDPLTQAQMAIVAELNRTFYEETLPTLSERHQNDQKLLQEHADAVAICNSNLEQSALQVNWMKDESDRAASTEAECTSVEGRLRDAEMQALSIMSDFLATTESSCGDMPEAKPTPEMETWIMCSLSFAMSFNSTYYSYKAAAMAAESAAEAMSTNCSMLDSTAAEKLCSWSNELGMVKGNYEHCRSETVTLFEETKATAMDNMEGRKSDYSALVKIQCYLQVLLSGDTSNAGNVHTLCDNAAINTHEFDIMVPDLAPYSTWILESLGTPAAICSEDESAYDESAYEESASVSDEETDPVKDGSCLCGDKNFYEGASIGDWAGRTCGESENSWACSPDITTEQIAGRDYMAGFCCGTMSQDEKQKLDLSVKDGSCLCGDQSFYEGELIGDWGGRSCGESENSWACSPDITQEQIAGRDYMKHFCCR